MGAEPTFATDFMSPMAEPTFMPPADINPLCDYTLGCPSYYMGAHDGCDCESDGQLCPDPDCGAAMAPMAEPNFMPTYMPPMPEPDYNTFAPFTFMPPMP